MEKVFLNLPTGFGKPLIFQCFLIIANITNNKPHGSSVVVVIWLLRSLMEDQVQYSKSPPNSGIPAVSITNDENPQIIQQVLNGNYILVFSLPEWFVVLNYMDSYGS